MQLPGRRLYHYLCSRIGDDFLVAAETLYNVDKDLFESNFSFMFSHLVVILASEIKEG